MVYAITREGSEISDAATLQEENADSNRRMW
jgi:hypothetical protein